MVRQWKELLITPRGGATEGYSVAALVVVLLAFSLMITGFIISMCADGASKGRARADAGHGVGSGGGCAAAGCGGGGCGGGCGGG
ncbi:hypothetical protein Scep_016282 [Stephania cephalantha]|uniref:Uncharacterized protein n=1 Tax=Stephania cephalantha TaxID=152367 RepID=A0AAP0IMC0_9MAGN